MSTSNENTVGNSFAEQQSTNETKPNTREWMNWPLDNASDEWVAEQIFDYYERSSR